MVKYGIVVVFGVIVTLLALPGHAGEEDPRQIMLNNEQARKADISEVAELTMTLVNKSGSERVRKVEFVLDDTDPRLRRSYLRFMSPANVRGTAFVQLEHDDRDNDRWLYLPALRKTRRISGSAKTDSFVGTDFSFEDFEILDGEVGGRNYKYTLLGEERFRGEKCWLIKAVPATAEARANTGYGERRMWVEQEHYHVLFTEYYDHELKLVKQMEASNLSLVPDGKGGEVRPHKLVMKNLLTDHTTIIEFENFVLNKPLDKNMFSRDYLSRGMF